jgi:integrase
MARRRGRGEGSIYRRNSDGLWIGAVTLEDSGKKRYVSGETRQEVQRKLGALQREIEQGIAPGDGRQTLAHYLANWLETIKPTIGDGAWLRHEEFGRIHIIPRIGRVKLAKVTPQMVQGLYAALLSEAGLSSTTVNHLHGSLHKALDAAVRLRLIGSNPTDFVDVPRMAPQEIHPLTSEQARTLLEAASWERYGERLEALFVMALATGMRQGELLALHWRDVDLARRSLSVRWNLRYRTGVFTFKEPKTKRSRRRIALAPQTVDRLRAHRARQVQERLLAGEVWEDNDLVFASAIGTPLSPNGMPRSAFMRVMGRAGLPASVRFHDLRHTCATLALSSNVNPKVVSEMLGHSTVAVTLDIYSHVMPDMQEDAASIIGALLYGQ